MSLEAEGKADDHSASQSEQLTICHQIQQLQLVQRGQSLILDTLKSNMVQLHSSCLTLENTNSPSP